MLFRIRGINDKTSATHLGFLLPLFFSLLLRFFVLFIFVFSVACFLLGYFFNLRFGGGGRGRPFCGRGATVAEAKAAFLWGNECNARAQCVTKLLRQIYYEPPKHD